MTDQYQTFQGADGQHYQWPPPAGWWQAGDGRWYPPPDGGHNEARWGPQQWDARRRPSSSMSVLIVGAFVVLGVLVAGAWALTRATGEPDPAAGPSDETVTAAPVPSTGADTEAANDVPAGDPYERYLALVAEYQTDEQIADGVDGTTISQSDVETRGLLGCGIEWDPALDPIDAAIADAYAGSDTMKLWESLCGG